MSTPNNPFAERKSPLLCYVTDRKSLASASPEALLTLLAQKIEELAAAGIDWVQIREKDLPARELSALVQRALGIAERASAKRQSRIRLLVNDRLDLAITQRAGGVHLGEKSLPVAEAKRLVESAVRRGLLDEQFLIGASCHSLTAAQTAQRDGAAYIVFGPVFATPAKESFGPPQGLEHLAKVCRSVEIPVLAIGGITPENAGSCLQAGAAGLAAIRLFQTSADPLLTIRRLHQLSTDCRPQRPGDPPSA